MDRLWLITNPRSGSAAPEKCAAVEAVCEERGLNWAGRTRFPNEPLPGPDALRDADTVVLFAGDGTINAALRQLEGWGGDVLILPGGTMNMLARRLHASMKPHEIIRVAHQAPVTTRLPYAEAGDARAYVGLIAGPVTAWAEAREAVREGALADLTARAAEAWSSSWKGEVVLHDGERLLGGYQAVYVEPRDGGLAATGIAAESIADLAKLGWAWATGDWRGAGNVDETLASTVLLTSDGGVQALFDGELVTLESPAMLRAGVSELRFLSTR